MSTETETNANPYTYPTSESLSADSFDRQVDFVPIMNRWERLRLYYNAVLVAEVLLVTLLLSPLQFFEPRFILLLCVGAAFSNLCFMTGPAIEAYGTCFRIWSPFFTIALFLSGLILTASLALVSVVTIL